jgi:hypothetical protein
VLKLGSRASSNTTLNDGVRERPSSLAFLSQHSQIVTVQAFLYLCKLAVPNSGRLEKRHQPFFLSPKIPELYAFFTLSSTLWSTFALLGSATR